ncbi:DUF1292 domain-containing protein [Fonticella tunisiensis]|uniref:DUF1292 domain-containing protein n=1 Tax=Fonticella tunisiensis TaxID=1096341 RepID=A0A4R7KBQ3_9CLOT|nr:DUF1292 domain-containing protein [Fonticella tunisiensis]TDT51906.1 hypothetical protein EDD71_11742 [Fonticella tunisiensis]
MGKALDYIRKEKEYYGKILYNINSAISDISPYVDKRELNERKYVSRVSVLKRYMELLDEVESREEKDGILGFLNDDKNIRELEEFKRKNNDALTQLEKCNMCQRLKCPAGCKLASCLSCRPGSWVAYCDHERIKVTFHDNFILDLTNERTGVRERFKVLATVEDDLKNKQYIIIEGLSSREKYVLYYYPGIVEDTYGEITDEEEFDFIVSVFESVER